jgi:hypothetical protein
MSLTNTYVMVYGQLPEFFKRLAEGQAPSSFTRQYLKDTCIVRTLIFTSTRAPSRLMIVTNRSRVKRPRLALRMREKSAAASAIHPGPEGQRREIRFHFHAPIQTVRLSSQRLLQSR